MRNANIQLLESLTAYMALWVTRNLNRLMWAATGTVCLSLVITLTALQLTAFSPYAGEIVQGLMIEAGTAISWGLVALAVLVVVALAMHNFGKGITVSFEVPTATASKLLGMGRFQEPDISPDTLICHRPGETAEQFEARMNAAIEAATPAKWVVVIPFRQPGAMIYQGPHLGANFTRDEPPFQTPEWPAEKRIVAPGTYFAYESENDYAKYLQSFAYYFVEFSRRAKLEVTTGYEKSRVFRALAVGCFALFFAFLSPCFAQNAQRLQNALGEKAARVPGAGIELSYVFSNKTYNRKADGVKNYVEVLTSVPNYRDNGGGDFVALIAEGKTIAYALPATTAPADMRPYSQAVEPREMAMPDSVSMAEQAERVKKKIGFYEGEAWKAIRPWWGVVMYAFWALSAFLVIAMAALRFWIYITSSEGEWDLYRKARRGLVIVVGAFSTVLLLDAMITLAYLHVGVFWMAIAAIALAWLSGKIAGWVIPNFNPDQGNMPPPTSTWGGGGYNGPQLGSGR